MPKFQEQGNPEQGPHIHSTGFFHQTGLDCALKFQGVNLPLSLWFCNSSQGGAESLYPKHSLAGDGFCVSQSRPAAVTGLGP